LAGGLAGLAARGRGAVAWAPGTARGGRKAGLTGLALAFGKWTSPWPASPQAKERKIGAWKEENGAEKSAEDCRKRKGDKYYIWGRRRNSLTYHFKLTVDAQFQDTAENEHATE
jgi:hypothetical protein